MKKAISILISGVMMVSSMPFTTIAAETEKAAVSDEIAATNIITENGIKYEIYDDHAVAIGYSEDIKADLVIADNVSEKTVTGIGKEAFAGCEAIKTIFIPDTVCSVGSGAFMNCHNLISAEFSSKAMTYDEKCDEWTGVFILCPSLEKITYSALNSDDIDSGYRVNNFLFGNELNQNIDTEEMESYELAGSFGNYMIPKSFKTIEVKSGEVILGNEFYELVTVEEIILPDTITTINRSAFAECKNLKKVNIPKSLKYIGDYAFGDCSNIEWGDIEFPENLECIGAEAFTNNKNITSLMFPENVKEVSYRAFSYCENLETIIFENPDTVIIDEEGSEHDGFFYSWRTDDLKGIVKGYKGSKAEEYAIKYNTNFEALISEKSGDSNGDGRIDMSDAVLIMQTIANPSKYKLNEQGSKNADMDDDGVTNLDALAIQKKLLKLEY